MFLFIFAAAAQTALTIFAAASLHAAFLELGERFESAHPDVTVRFDFDGSQILEAQLAQGAQADVFASADQRWMDEAVSDGLVGASAPFATNTLVVAANDASPVQSVRDLSKPGLRIVLCADAVPCGRYARKAITKIEEDQTYGKGFAAAVTANIVSVEENVEAVLAKVTLGEADAGMVYRSDVATVPAHVRVVELPAAAQPAVLYPIAVLKKSPSPVVAESFVAFVRSKLGQDILRQYGFGPP